LSRRKRWRVIEVISKAAQFSNLPESAT